MTFGSVRVRRPALQSVRRPALQRLPFLFRRGSILRRGWGPARRFPDQNLPARGCAWGCWRAGGCAGCPDRTGSGRRGRWRGGCGRCGPASLRGRAAPDAGQGGRMLSERAAAGSGGAFWVECRARERAIDFEAARGVVQIENDAAAFFRNHAHGLVEDFAAMAVGREDVAGGAAGVHTNEHGMRAGLTRFGWGGAGRSEFPVPR